MMNEIKRDLKSNEVNPRRTLERKNTAKFLDNLSIEDVVTPKTPNCTSSQNPKGIGKSEDMMSYPKSIVRITGQSHSHQTPCLTLKCKHNTSRARRPNCKIDTIHDLPSLFALSIVID
jgi:hypothetical protein